MCVSVSEGVQGAHLKTVLLDFCQTGPVDPDFLCQEQSLNPYGSFEPKTNFLDLSVQKLRVLLDLMYSPFLFSFIVLKIQDSLEKSHLSALRMGKHLKLGHILRGI